MARYFLLKTINLKSNTQPLKFENMVHLACLSSLQMIPGIKKIKGCSSEYKNNYCKTGFEIIFRGTNHNAYVNFEKKIRQEGFELWLTKEDAILRTKRLALLRRLKSFMIRHSRPKNKNSKGGG